MTIVVGYSPSGQGMAALQAAVRYAQRSRSKLMVASHLYNDPEHGPTAATADAVRAALDEVGAQELDVEVCTSSEADIGEFLLGVVESSEATLLVIGLRRKSPIGKLNLGASARRVVLGAPCPVLAVKDEHTPLRDSSHVRV
ncbi:MAG TPA: universal stress protein [Candidatus Brachybacterium merdavium]|uniref:Universal stress protein n=1 Tax=Candidatus Brachybacterium merdavium TaxID=2838513 RepID=A0A9D2LFE8_9MICO|nr:universal stress protein [Candidatus Brachybacterium merdavium]